MNKNEYIISSKRTGDHTDPCTMAAGEDRERTVEDLAVGAGSGICEGNIL